MDAHKLLLIEQRVIEARSVVPLILAFGEIVGLEKAISVVQQVHQAASREAGRRCAAAAGANDLDHLVEEIASWGEGGVLEAQVLKRTPAAYAFNVTRCRYAEHYEALGYRQFGYSLSCCRDRPFAEGFNPDITFERTQTIMEGAAFCDFRYTFDT